MVHLSKLAVGVRDVPHLSALQTARLANDGALLHRTRSAPRRLPELLDGGSLYWIIAGVMLVRQRVLAVTQGARDDGTPCAELHLHPTLIRLIPRAVRPFQGWRYLEPPDAPPDAGAPGQTIPDMPDHLLTALRSLALL